MASINSLDVKKNKVVANIHLSKEEYKMLKNETDNLAIFPVNTKKLDQILTTGKLGNSNRIMVPKKFLEKEGIEELEKKVMSGIIRKDEDVFLVVRLRGLESDKSTLKWETRLVRK